MIMANKVNRKTEVVDAALLEFEKITSTQKLSPMGGLLAVTRLFSHIYELGFDDGWKTSKINQN